MGLTRRDPSWLNPSFELNLVGRLRNAGVLEIRFEGTDFGFVDLPRSGMALVLLLFNNSKQARDWGEIGLDSSELAQLGLQHRLPLPDDPNRIPHVVLRVRKLLAAVDERKCRSVGVQPGQKFAASLLQSHPTLKYRLALPPENLHLPEYLRLPAHPQQSSAAHPSGSRPNAFGRDPN